MCKFYSTSYNIFYMDNTKPNNDSIKNLMTLLSNTRFKIHMLFYIEQKQVHTQSVREHLQQQLIHKTSQP